MDQQPTTSQNIDKDHSEITHSQVISEDDRKILIDKMKEMFATMIRDIDSHVLETSNSQSDLDTQLDELISVLNNIKIDENLTDEINSNSKKIKSIKERLTITHTILKNCSARCNSTLAACEAAVNSLTNQSH